MALKVTITITRDDSDQPIIKLSGDAMQAAPFKWLVGLPDMGVVDSAKTKRVLYGLVATYQPILEFEASGSTDPIEDLLSSIENECISVRDYYKDNNRYLLGEHINALVQLVSDLEGIDL